MPKTLPANAPGELVDRGRYSYFRPDSLQEVSIDLLPETESRLTHITDLMQTVSTEILTGDNQPRIEDAVWDESYASSQIEGIPEPHSTVAYNPETGRPDVPLVKTHVDALMHALSFVQNAPDLTEELVKHLHTILLEPSQLDSEDCGVYRSQQVFIGGGDDPFIPPTPGQIQDLMTDLFAYLHSDTGRHWLVDVALVHYQFETIHPFIDGNGRVGRMLSILHLLLESPVHSLVFSPSTTLFDRRDAYYDGLSDVSYKGAWESWIRLYLDAVEDSVLSAYPSLRY